MLPPPPPTDPDVRNYRIRFFALELRSGRRTYLPSMTQPVERRRQRRPPGSAIHCRFVDRVMRFSALSCCPPMVSMRDASLPSIGSRRARFPDVSSTMKALRLPAPHPRSLMDSLAGSTLTSCPSCLAAALPRGRRYHAGQGPCSAGAPFPGAPSRGRIRDLPGSLTILPMPLPSSRTPVGPTSPRRLSVTPVLPPLRGLRRLRTIRTISGLTTGLQHPLSTLPEHPCGYPGKTRFRLAGLPLPCGSRTRWIATEGFQLTYMAFLLLRAYPGATSLRSG